MVSRQPSLPLIAFGCLRSPLIASDRFPIASLIASRIASLIRYTSTGQLDIVPYTLRSDLVNWRRRFGKPVMLSEYGADAACMCSLRRPRLPTGDALRIWRRRSRRRAQRPSHRLLRRVPGGVSPCPFWRLRRAHAGTRIRHQPPMNESASFPYESPSPFRALCRLRLPPRTAHPDQRSGLVVLATARRRASSSASTCGTLRTL